MKRRLNLIVALACVAAVAVFALVAYGAPQDKEKVTAEPVDAAAEKARLALVVAKIDGVEIPLSYFETALDRQSPLLRKELADPAKRKDFLDKLLNMEVLANEAKKRGFESDPEVASVRKNQLASLMHRKIADETPEVAPTEEAMRKYYDAHADSYNKPEKVRARHILISDKAKAEKLLADMLAKTPSQYEFRRAAQEQSEDGATKNRGGDLTFFTRPGERGEGDPEVPEAIANAAFGLKENGEIARSLVKTDKGYHLVMRTGHRDKMSMTFEEAKERLGMLVQREQRKEAIEAKIGALEKAYPITLHEENLKDVVIDLSGGPANSPGDELMDPGSAPSPHEVLGAAPAAKKEKPKQ